MSNKVDKLFDILVQREQNGEEGLLAAVLQETIDTAFKTPGGAKIEKIKSVCKSAVSSAKLISIINKVLHNVATTRKTHVAARATTGEFKEYDNKDVQTLIHQYATKPKKTVEVPLITRIYTFLNRRFTTVNFSL